MITVAAAFAHVDSSTSDGIAHCCDWSHGYGPRCDPAEDRVEDAGRARVVERLPEEHRDDRRDHDREVRERAVEAARACAPRSSAPPRRAGSDSRRSSASSAKYAVFLHGDRQAAGRATTRSKFWNPTHVAGCTRFVCCSDMITVRTIGYHENAPKTNSSGSRKSSVVRPPPRTHVSGVRRRRGEHAARAARASTSTTRRGSTSVSDRRRPSSQPT